jgi:hypothetical protein
MGSPGYYDTAALVREGGSVVGNPKENAADLAQRLTPMQFRVTPREGTEAPSKIQLRRVPVGGGVISSIKASRWICAAKSSTTQS